MTNEGEFSQGAPIPDGDPFLAFIRGTDFKVDSAYDAQLAQETMPKSERISFDDIRDGDGSSDHKIRRMTEIIAKFGEYTSRLGTDKRDLATTPLAQRSDYYKREAARLALTRPSVNVLALERALMAVHGSIDLARFRNGWKVVQNYIQDGGSKVTRGTGLPNFTGINK